jgi:hypothetical protein
MAVFGGVEQQLQGSPSQGVGGQARAAGVGSYGRFFMRILGVFVLPALVMIGVGRIAPNPDGVLVLALACMFGARYYLKP